MALSNSLSLLTIPREIRNLIYTELLCIPKTPPSSPSDPGPRFHDIFLKDKHLELSGERFPAHSHVNLLLCNHQLHSEFLAFLDTAYSSWEYAKLDCIMSYESFWPTWIIFPAGRHPKIRNLDIDLRVWDLMSPCDLSPGVEASAIMGKLWVFFQVLLFRLLEYGPSLRFNEYHRNTMPVDSISFQIQFQAPTTQKKLGNYDEDSQVGKIGIEIEDSELEKIGSEIEKSLQEIAPWMRRNCFVKMLRLKVKNGDKVREFVVGNRESATEKSGV